MLYFSPVGPSFRRSRYFGGFGLLGFRVSGFGVEGVRFRVQDFRAVVEVEGLRL